NISEGHTHCRTGRVGALLFPRSQSLSPLHREDCPSRPPLQQLLLSPHHPSYPYLSRGHGRPALREQGEGESSLFTNTQDQPPALAKVGTPWIDSGRVTACLSPCWEEGGSMSG
ncbi:hypothetical protein H1C71_021445, partial [Ictidomys tridecemlineatus]